MSRYVIGTPIAVLTLSAAWYFNRKAQKLKRAEKMRVLIRNRQPNTALEATPHSHCVFASEFSGCLTRWVRGASAFVR